MRKALLVLVAVLILGLSSLGGWFLYQRHLSGDLRRVLVASCDPGTTRGDLESYLRSSRLMVRTKRDAELQSKLEHMIQWSFESSDTQARLLNESFSSLRGGFESSHRFGELIEERVSYLKSGRQVPKYLQDQIDEMKQAQIWEKSQREASDLEEKRAVDEGDRAKKLYMELRSDLKLPPPKM